MCKQNFYENCCKCYTQVNRASTKRNLVRYNCYCYYLYCYCQVLLKSKYVWLERFGNKKIWWARFPCHRSTKILVCVNFLKFVNNTWLMSLGCGCAVRLARPCPFCGIASDKGIKTCDIINAFLPTYPCKHIHMWRCNYSFVIHLEQLVYLDICKDLN